MSYVSTMTVQVKPDTAKAALAAFVQQRIFAECKHALPGFDRGELLQSTSEPEQILIIAHWQTLADLEAWQLHPVRARQLQDLSHFAVSVSASNTYHVSHCYP
jgi:heme-degrading monooxygenase HmoA